MANMPRNRTVCGIGIMDVPRATTKHRSAYSSWCRMLERCYDNNWHKKHPTYIGCTVDERWHKFSNFLVWHNANSQTGLQLDKDCLHFGNKVYSTETCVFISQELNHLMTNKQSQKGELPTGVTFDKSKGKYKAQLKVMGRNLSAGRFATSLEAVKAYCNAKYKHGKQVIARDLERGYLTQAQAEMVKETLIANLTSCIQELDPEYQPKRGESE